MNRAFHHFARKMAEVVGSPYAFVLALLVVIVWACSGPIFHFSETWQLIINTGTTIVTFLMTFVIQATQNSDAAALHKKIDNLLVSLKEPDSDLAGIEKEE
jgi:low affinity Fe/Cu permease